MNELLMRRRMMMGGKPMMQVVWNQLLTYGYIEKSKTGDGTDEVYINYSENLDGTHKHLLLMDVKVSDVELIDINRIYDNNNYYGYIDMNQITERNVYQHLYSLNNASNKNRITLMSCYALRKLVTISGRNAMIIDLTQMFGAGNEPTTYAQFANWLQENGINPESYIPYDAGTPRMMTKPSWIINNNERL